MSASPDTPAGVCEICGERALFPNELRCFKHPLGP
jgi:hypothetical protein